MRAYVITTAVIFALIALAHVARVVDEGTQVVQNPTVIVSTVIALGLVVWAIRVLRVSPRS